jgi:hypothetical protein
MVHQFECAARDLQRKRSHTRIAARHATYTMLRSRFSLAFLDRVSRSRFPIELLRFSGYL